MIDGWCRFTKYDGPAIDVRLVSCDAHRAIGGSAKVANADNSSSWVQESGDAVLLPAIGRGNNWLDTWDGGVA
ncbi:hypothetical protein [Streptomyces tritici]|uniref:hypothetical protein n=1 Tax=Streptomyces tritici TaxID=2054410 RepID=UPI003AEF62F0